MWIDSVIGLYPILLLFSAVTMSLWNASAQELAPRAYIITPIHTNAITLTYSLDTGSLIFDGAVPITDATATVNLSVVSLFHSLSLWRHSANIAASLPYALGNFQANVAGVPANQYRSGLLDSTFRFSLNLKGGPAMDVGTFRKWRQKTIVGVSFKVAAPTGQYDPTKLINYGGNRWAFKPELGLSRRWEHWVLDSYGGVWFFTSNPEFFSSKQASSIFTTQSQSPVGAFEGHFSYDVRPRFWVSLDGNFWFGGRTSVNGVANPNTVQRNCRVGGTVSLPLNRNQSLKFSYANGAYIRYGGNYQSLSVAWQFSWLGKPN